MAAAKGYGRIGPATHTAEARVRETRPTAAGAYNRAHNRSRTRAGEASRTTARGGSVFPHCYARLRQSGNRRRLLPAPPVDRVADGPELPGPALPSLAPRRRHLHLPAGNRA